MTFNILLTGVGGEGVLTTATIVARAAVLEGHEVGGIQLHGLAQRGGVVPTHVRFGKTVHSPTIPRGEADLILALELVEAARMCYFADKRRTNFLIDTYSLRPVYANLLKERYPSVGEVKRMIAPFARKTIALDASGICREKLGSSIYGDTMMLGIALKAKSLPLGRQSIEDAIKSTIRRDLEKNLAAFEMGLKYDLAKA